VNSELQQRSDARRMPEGAAPKRRSVGGRRNRRRMDLRPLLLVVSLGILALTCGLAARLSPRFVIREDTVRVRGVSPDLAFRVRAIAGLPGSNWVTLPVDAVRMRVASLPQIGAVSLRRLWPNRVELIAVPRTTWGALQARDGRWFRVDRSLVPFGVLDGPLDGQPQVVFRTRGAETVVFGNPVGVPAEVEPVVRCWNWARRHPEFPLARIVLDREGAMCLNGNGGVVVYLGTPERLDTKLEALARILEERPDWSDARNVAYINLVSDNAPAVMPRR
jgi:cell division septal protein FtsQ